MERLDKLISSTGRWSRRQAKALVKMGRVRVGGTIITVANQKYSPFAVIEVDGTEIICERYSYIMLYKPAGILSATEDHRQPTVLDLLPEHLRHIGLFPTGRLDKDAEGLLLLTNDGELAHRLLAPKKHVDKTYFVKVNGTLTKEDVTAFELGMTLGDGQICLSAGLKILESTDTAIVTLREGKYHQIKRMLAVRGKPVCYLKRLTMGSLILDAALNPGEYRFLTLDEHAGLCDPE